jgi:hypothetical protein
MKFFSPPADQENEPRTEYVVLTRAEIERLERFEK